MARRFPAKVLAALVFSLVFSRPARANTTQVPITPNLQSSVGLGVNAALATAGLRDPGTSAVLGFDPGARLESTAISNIYGHGVYDAALWTFALADRLGIRATGMLTTGVIPNLAQEIAVRAPQAIQATVQRIEERAVRAVEGIAGAVTGVAVAVGILPHSDQVHLSGPQTEHLGLNVHNAMKGVSPSGPSGPGPTATVRPVGIAPNGPSMTSHLFDGSNESRPELTHPAR